MLFYIILLIPLHFQTITCEKDVIPVFLIDEYKTMKDLKVDTNPFRKISTAYFAEVVRDAIKKAQVVIVFIEERFSVEDISCKDPWGTPFRYLHDGLKENKVKYFPKVDEPYKLLSQLLEQHPFNVFHLGTGVNLRVLEGKFKHIYIYFRDGRNETRIDVLRRHDVMIKDILNVMRNLIKGPVLAFYTGKVNPVRVASVEFVPIAPVTDVNFPGVLVITDGALFRFIGVYAATYNRRAMFNQVPIVAEETWAEGSLTTKMAYSDFDLQFNFKLRETDWLLDTVTLIEGGEEVGRTNMAVGAPWHYAYYCGEPLVVINNRDGSSVIISEYKIQPFSERQRICLERKRRFKRVPITKVTVRKSLNTTVTGFRRDDEPEEPEAPEAPVATEATDHKPSSTECIGFGGTVNCGPYFSAVILTCLFIVMICLIILGMGVIFLSDIRTNGRYDDPHGKMLVIGAEG